MLVDFSKAFDTVDYAIVLRKANVLMVCPSVKNWIISFLNNRVQITKLFDTCSLMLEINRSIVQVSEIGPYLYILMESDLCTLRKSNI
jgi:hypothetical protein